MKKIMLLVSLLVSVGAFAQTAQTATTELPAEEAAHVGPWTLEDCINYALDHNITVQQSAISVGQKEVSLNTAEMSRLPGVSASASESFSFGRGLTSDNTYTNNNTTSTAFSLGAQLPIFQGFDINNSIKASKLELAAATEDLEKAKDDIRVQVAQAYIQILYDQEILEVAESQAEHDELLLTQIQGQKDNGKASGADVAAQEATLAQSRLSVTQAKNTLTLDMLTLTQLLELPSIEGFEVVRPDVSELEFELLMNPEDIYAEAVEIKPAVQSAVINLEVAEVNIAKAKGAYLPTLSLTGSLSTNYYTVSNVTSASFGDQMKNNFSPSLGLSLSIPIFSKFSTRNSVRTAELNKKNQELQVESVKKSLYKEIQQAYYNALASQEKCISSEQSAESARLHYELTEQKYLNGKASIADYNDSKNTALSAESEALKARYECLYQTRLLDFYRGEELTL